MNVFEATNFYIDRITGTFADRLVTFGWARVLAELHMIQGTNGNVTIHDEGPYDRVSCAMPIRAETVEQLREYPRWFCDAAIIKTAANAAGLPDDLLDKFVVNYDDERERVTQFHAARDKAQDSTISPEPPHRDWDIFRAINPGALKGYNGILLDWWKARSAQPETVSLLMELFSGTPNQLSYALSAWTQISKSSGIQISKVNPTSLQLFNPVAGKGTNHPKSVWSRPDNLSGFWLFEWLKIIGFYEAALTRQVRGAKDRKTFVVAPRQLTYTQNSQIMSQFADKMRYSETATKFDILAAIRYAQTLLEYLLEPQQRSLLAIGNLKHKLVGGFHTAFYKDMGNTTATMNVAFIALPGWITVRTSDDIDVYTKMLEELEKLTKQFEESHSDAYNLLQSLRDFVSGDDLTAFFRFTNAYPAYLIGMGERGKYAYTYTTEFIERLIMSIDRPLSEILESEGFRNVAYAIRQSTITAQYRKNKLKDRRYDVRYGLGQDLARKSRYGKDFVTTLSDFLFKYNAECAQIMETRPGPYRRMVKTDDIEEIVRLIDLFGSETVANLLIAYGYARVERVQEEDDSAFIIQEEQN